MGTLAAYDVMKLISISLGGQRFTAHPSMMKFKSSYFAK